MLPPPRSSVAFRLPSPTWDLDTVGGRNRGSDPVSGLRDPGNPPRGPAMGALDGAAAAQPGAAPTTASSSTSASLVPGGALYAQQWHLTDEAAGIDVVRVWADYAGRAVRIVLIDEGVQHAHKDLVASYRTAIDRDFAGRDMDAAPVGSREWHGTAVAGIIGARADNDIGGAGVAPGADLAGFRVSFGTRSSTGEILSALTASRAFDVVNNSWEFTSFFGDSFAGATFRAHGQAIQDAVRLGRGGLGSNIVFAAGNGGARGDDVNFHDFQNSPYVIAVAATDQAGAIAPFSTPGAAILVAAPGVRIVTTDLVGSAGFDRGDYTALSGTSAAAPVVSGVVALMLEANGGLGYRDVQQIVAYSANRTAPFEAEARTNAAQDWNGGGLTFNRDYGFGLVDAHAAVRLAENWDAVSTYSTMVTASAASTSRLIIGDLQTVTGQVTVQPKAMQIDRVEVWLDINHGRIGDLVITLLSPLGTASTLVERPGVSAASTLGSTLTSIKFTMDSVHFWGETVGGTWTLQVQDAARGQTGIVNGWRLDFIGDAARVDDTYVYTDDYAGLGSAAARSVLRDDDGGFDTMNLAAVTAAVLVDLAPGGEGLVLGRRLAIAADTSIEAAIGGDGADTLIGNAVANRLTGGRGVDDLRGGDGADVFAYARLADGGDMIRDFTAEDRLDLADLLSRVGYRGSRPFADGWLSAVEDGAETRLMLDADGASSIESPLTFLRFSGTGLGLGDGIIA